MSKMEETLNELWKNNPNKYQEELAFIKCMGCRVYRNSEGLHIIKYNADDTIEAFNQIKQQSDREKINAFMKGFLG